MRDSAGAVRVDGNVNRPKEKSLLVYGYNHVFFLSKCVIFGYYLYMLFVLKHLKETICLNLFKSYRLYILLKATILHK